jgi:hypothetical protein
MVQTTTTWHVSVARFDGSAWQPMGGPLIAGGSAVDYDMAIDPTGAPIVADAESVIGQTSVASLFSYRWGGAGWQAAAPSETATPPPQVYVWYPTIAVDSKGRLVAAWRNLANGAWTIAVARFQP